MIKYLTDQEITDLIVAEAASDKKEKRTPEQIEAIYSHGNNILVSASAGSGKTFVMVQRILDMIGRGVSVNQLFISTFTVKAAGELKERLEKTITKSLSQAKTDEERQHLTENLSQLATADIGTMDAFTQKLVNQYGYLIGVSPIFRIMAEQSEQDILKNEVYYDLFTDYMRGEKAHIFQQLVRNFAGRGKDSKTFRSLIYKIYAFSQSTAAPQDWLQETFLKSHQEMRDYDSLPNQMVETLLDTMIETANNLRDLTDSPDYSQITKAGKPTAAYTKHLLMIEHLIGWANDFTNLYGKSGLGRLAADVKNLIPSGNDVTVAKIKYPIFKNLHSQLSGLKHLETILAYQGQALPLLEVLRDFLLDFSDQYLQAKKNENAFEFNDIAHFAIEILENHDQVRQTYQDLYEEVMVDEYQDNNHTQERLLELLSNGRNRFMVGDIKQSIYRFRQADPKIFGQKMADFQQHPSHGKLIVLKENFRSHTEVLDASNGVFRHLMDETIGDVDYNDTHVLIAGNPAKQEPVLAHRTQVLIYDTDSDEGLEGDNLTKGEIDLVAKEIIRLHNEEGISFSEITLLVSSRTRNTALLRTFGDYGIPIVADGGETNYLKSMEVMVMLDTLRTINNPLYDYPLVALMRSPMFAFNEDELARLAIQGEKVPLYDKLLLAIDRGGAHSEIVTESLFDKLSRFLETLDDWRHFAKSHSLYDLIWKIYNDRFYYDYVGATPKAEQAQSNLYALALRANVFEQTGFKGLARFINMIDKILENDSDLADVEIAPPKNAVQLMTIHKSKGLEFKYVFVLNLDKTFAMDDIKTPILLSRNGGVGIKYLADMKREFTEVPFPHLRVLIETLPYQQIKRDLKLAMLSEQMRLLYVAMTRAEKRLYLVGKGSKSKLENKFDTKIETGRLPVSLREQLTSFQDWFLALEAAFSRKELAFEIHFVSREELVVGQLETPQILDIDNQTDNRQSDQIREALDFLENVDKLNQAYSSAINLPSVRTPSEVKHFYEPVMEAEGVALIDQVTVKDTQLDFELPDFGKKSQVTRVAVGSATHELMQRLVIDKDVSLNDLEEALDKVDADADIKAQISLDKLLTFFKTELGKLIVKHQDKLHREAPFAMLTTDPVSKEDFVVRGIIDGYLLFDDHIVLFDYKTDKFTDPSKIAQRYSSQMALYRQALSRSYGIKQVDAYLILLGGQDLEVIAV